MLSRKCSLTNVESLSRVFETAPAQKQGMMECKMSAGPSVRRMKRRAAPSLTLSACSLALTLCRAAGSTATQHRVDKS